MMKLAQSVPGAILSVVIEIVNLVVVATHVGATTEATGVTAAPAASVVALPHCKLVQVATHYQFS
jgi:hypothetical protein